MDPRLVALAGALDSNFRPYVNHVVKPKQPVGGSPREAYERRAQKAIETGLNSFFFPAEMLEVDFLSDSGSSAMNTGQWAALLQGDESYGSNDGWPLFNRTVAEVFGQEFGSVFLGENQDAGLNARYKYKKNFNFLVNQGRGAESVLFNCLAEQLVQRDYKELPESSVVYDIACSNNFFDTTSGHILNIRDKRVEAPDGRQFLVSFRLVNHPNPKVRDGTYGPEDRYLGDGDIAGLERLLAERRGRVGCVFTTITNNSGGSQPVSLQHMARVSELCREHGVLYMLDACRFAENAYLIKQLEGTAEPVADIARRQFALADGFTISLKKDGISNCGGALCFKPSSAAVQALLDAQGGCLMQRIMDQVILQVGHFTYGALTGRDIKAVCVGLRSVVSEAYLAGRIGQVQRFAAMLVALGVPILTPCGSSAVYVDIDRFFDLRNDKKARGNYYGNSLVGLLLCAGIRACELGVSAFSSPHGNAPYTRPEDVSGNFVRLAIPRQLYADTDLRRAALYLAFLYEHRHEIKPVIDRPGIRHLSLHHFKMMFDFAK